MKITPRQEVERRWREHDLKRIEAGRRKHEKRIRNLGLVLRLEGGRRLEFRGRQYGVPPVPWSVAVRVQSAVEQMAELRSAGPAARWQDWAKVYREVSRLFKLATVPRHPVQRLLWRWWPSPMLRATPREVGEALSFFSVFLVLDGFENLSPAAPRGTSQPTSPGSSTPSPNGAVKAPRSRGSTS